MEDFQYIIPTSWAKRLQVLRAKVTGPRNIIAQELALKIAAAEDEAYRAAIMTTDMRMQFPIPLSDAETEAATCSLADTERVTNQLEREIYGMTSNEQKQF